MTDFDDLTALERVRALEAWEAEYQRFTAEYELRMGVKLEGDILNGWRWCYVELNHLG